MKRIHYGKIKNKIQSIILVVLIALLISVTVYSGEWPPLSVVQSDSMEHSSHFQWSTIETGTTVIVKKVTSPSQIITYIRGRETGFKTYGEYGDVILYRSIAGYIVIHRAMFYLSWNGDRPIVNGYTNQSWIDVTSSYVLLKDVGFTHRNEVIFISSFAGVSGYITTGDNNLARSSDYISSLNAYVAADQNILVSPGGKPFPPVNFSSIAGIARGDIPLIGLYKLYFLGATGSWSEENEIPAYSNIYLAILTVSVLAVIFFPYRRVIMKIRKK
ncbi:MAG: S26 family signal peptidase [Candidatus Thermoplasmatota archaeon]|nr:S26 family signal peptidase [Candidatus Thermoplasmatota archaeon]MCL5790717.1 S26 family signal peptidase [Candidatus Thermoplasmatota archaeon]